MRKKNVGHVIPDIDDMFLETSRPMQEMHRDAMKDWWFTSFHATELSFVLGLLFSSATCCASACSTYTNKNMTRVWHLEAVDTENLHKFRMGSLTYLPLPSFLPCFLPSFIPSLKFFSGFILFDACCKSIIFLILVFWCLSLWVASTSGLRITNLLAEPHVSKLTFLQEFNAGTGTQSSLIQAWIGCIEIRIT